MSLRCRKRFEDMAGRNMVLVEMSQSLVVEIVVAETAAAVEIDHTLAVLDVLGVESRSAGSFWISSVVDLNSDQFHVR